MNFCAMSADVLHPRARRASVCHTTDGADGYSLNVELGESEVGQRLRRATLALIGERDAHGGEEALNGCRGRRAAKVKYCRAITARLGKYFWFSFHQSIPAHSDEFSICGSARYALSSSACGFASSVFGAGAGLPCAAWCACPRSTSPAPRRRAQPPPSQQRRSGRAPCP